MEKVDPDKLRDSLPKFKPWMSRTSWHSWEEFLEITLDMLSSVPNNEGSWPLLTIEVAASHRCQQEVNVSTEGTQELEEMLDDERVAVEV